MCSQMTSKDIWAWFQKKHPARRKHRILRELSRRCTLKNDGRFVWSGGKKKKHKKQALSKDPYATLKRALKNRTKQGLAARELLEMGAGGICMDVEDVRAVLNKQGSGVGGHKLKRWAAPAWKENEKLARGVFRLPHPFLVGSFSLRLHKKLYTFYKEI